MGNGEIVRAVQPPSTDLPPEIELLLDYDPDCDGLMFSQVCQLCNYTGSFFDAGRLILSVITHERVFWYNSKIGVRPNLQFRTQMLYSCCESGSRLLFELILEFLSRIEEPIEISNMMERLRGLEYVKPTGKLMVVNANDQETIEGFLDSLPIIFKRNSLYWMMPLESEVDIFGGL
jgi:hypothetical protein